MTKYEYSRPPVLAQDFFPFAAELNPRRPQRNQGAAGGLKGLAKWKGQPATVSQMDKARMGVTDHFSVANCKASLERLIG